VTVLPVPLAKRPAATACEPVTFHFNKGLAGAPPPAIEASRNTAMHPDALDAFALAIIASEGPPAFPGFPAPDLAAAGVGARASRLP
jgi:hypothetical protein